MNRSYFTDTNSDIISLHNIQQISLKDCKVSILYADAYLPKKYQVSKETYSALQEWFSHQTVYSFPEEPPAKTYKLKKS